MSDREHVIVRRMPDTPGLELLHARFVARAFPRHSHEGYGVGVVEAGGLRFFYRGEQIVAAAGSLNTVNPDEVHTGQAATAAGWTYRMLYFDAGFLSRMAESVADRATGLPFFTAGVIADAQTARLLAWVHRRLLGASVSRLEQDTLLLELFGNLLTRHTYVRADPPLAGREPAAVRRARDFLLDRLAEDVTLADTAAAACLSPYHFIRVFARHTGLTPHAWLMQQRAFAARRLILGGAPAAAAAAHAGFVDQSHLSRTFRRLFGFTPGQLRNCVQGC